MPGIQIGQIVKFVLDAMFGPNCGEIRPAMVVRLWGSGCVQLCVFVDGGNDCPPHNATVEVTLPGTTQQCGAINAPITGTAGEPIPVPLTSISTPDQVLHGHVVNPEAPLCVWRTSVCEDAQKKPGTWHR